MFRKKIVPLLALACAISSTGSATRALGQEENVRSVFMSTRVSAGTASGTAAAAIGGSSGGGGYNRTSRRQARRANRNTGGASASVKGGASLNAGGASAGVKGAAGATTGGNKRAGGGSNNTAGNKTTGNKTIGNNTPLAGNIPVNSFASTPLGMGYSIYMRDGNGDPVRVDPAREFRAGDRIRIALETNADGFLYVFHTENNQKPQMIFPDARLDGGENFVEAHVPYEIPWSGETDESLRWFVFDQNPAIERLYIVLTREPLPGIPTNEALVAYCRQSGVQCPWRPADALWSQVRVNAAARVAVDKSNVYGQKQTSTEREATTRGLGLDPGAPQPTVVRMNVSANAPVLVTSIDLTHK